MITEKVKTWLANKGFKGEYYVSDIWMWINKNTDFWIICVPEIEKRKFHCEYYYEDDLIDYKSHSYENFEDALNECFEEISIY